MGDVEGELHSRAGKAVANRYGLGHLHHPEKIETREDLSIELAYRSAAVPKKISDF